MFQLVGKAIVGVLKTIFIRKKKCASKKNRHEKINSNNRVAFFLVIFPGAAANQQTGKTSNIYLCYAPGSSHEQTWELPEMRNEIGEGKKQSC